MSDFVSVKEVASWFGVSSTTMRKILVDEQIPVLILQKKWRIARADAEALLEDHYVVFEPVEEVADDAIV